MSDTAFASLRILTVCSHNRTRSVMMAALLESMLAGQQGVIRSSGFGPEGLPPIGAAVDAMRRRGLGVTGHRSRTTTADLVDWADLILTAERDHVVRIAGLSRPALARAMTLPEFLVRAADAAGAGDGDLRRWVESLTGQRTASAYLRDAVPEVDDPTGSPRRAFEAAVVAIERQCAEVVRHLTRIRTDRR